MDDPQIIHQQISVGFRDTLGSTGKGAVCGHSRAVPGSRVFWLAPAMCSSEPFRESPPGVTASISGRNFKGGVGGVRDDKG